MLLLQPFRLPLLSETRCFGLWVARKRCLACSTDYSGRRRALWLIITKGLGSSFAEVAIVSSFVAVGTAIGTAAVVSTAVVVGTETNSTEGF